MKKTISFEEYSRIWLDEKKLYLKESTYGAYSIIVYNYLNSYFGKYDLINIKEEEIQKFILYLLSNGKKNKKDGLSEKTVKDILMVLKMILRAADKKRLYEYKKMEIQFPRNSVSSKIKIVLEEDKAKLIKAVYNNLNSRNIGILLCLQTGLRIGELCSLQWQDINIERNLIKIDKTIQRIFIKDDNLNGKSKIIISTPKTYSSIRTVPISSDMSSLLKLIQPKKQEYYFLTGKTKYLEPHTYRVYYRNFLKKNGIEYIPFHSLRHTFASNCISLGVDCKVVSELLGHASVTTTLDLYVHPQLEEKRQCIELLCSSMNLD